MSVIRPITLSLSALLALAPAAAAQAPPSTLPGPPASERPVLLRDVSIEQRLGEQVPLDLVFRDEQGRPVRLGAYFGRRPVILTLVYYECPMLCIQVLGGLVGALKAVSFDAGEAFDVVAVSINPREPPGLAASKKRAHLERYGRDGAGDGFHYLTGEGPAIEALAEAVGFRYRYDEEIDQYAHAAAIMVATPEGRLARYFHGVEFSPRDLRLGLVEASNGRIGSPVDQVLLFCYHYDPATGRYGLIALRLVRLGGVLMILTLGTFLFVTLRRERTQQGSGAPAAGD